MGCRAHARTLPAKAEQWQMPSEARIKELFLKANDNLWPPPLAAAAAVSPATAAAAAAGRPSYEVLRVAFDEVVAPVFVVNGQCIRRGPSGLWFPDEWKPTPPCVQALLHANRA